MNPTQNGDQIADRQPDAAGMVNALSCEAPHPAFCADEPSEPHLDPGGDCSCLADCCNANERCICPDCKGTCGDH